MPRKKRSKKKSRRQSSKVRSNSKQAVTWNELENLEFHRHGFALMPDGKEHFPAVAFTVKAETKRTGYRFCSCRTSASQTCVHLKKLSQLSKALENGEAGVAGPEVFRDSFWYRFAVAMAESSRHRLDAVRLRGRGENGTSGEIRAYRDAGELIMSYLSEGPDRLRFVDRCTLSSDADTVPTRADVLHRLALLTLTDDERMMQERGFKTVRMALEEQFWYRLAYHGFREFGIEGCVLSPAIEESSGDFFIQGADTEGQPLLRAAVPRKQVKRVLSKLKDVLVNNAGLAVEPLCLDAVFDVALTKAMDLEIRPLLRQIRKNGEARFFEREDLAQFQYGDLYYIKELGTLVEDPYPKSPPSFDGLKKTVVQKSRVPLFLADHGQDMEKDLFRVAPEVQRLRIMNSFDRIEITPFAIDRDWYWLSIVYGDGSQQVSLADILKAKQEGRRFVSTASGWVDCEAPEFADFDVMAGRTGKEGIRKAGDREAVRLSRADLLRFRAVEEKPLSVKGEAGKIDLVDKLLSLKPVTPMPELRGLSSTLRAYQQRGAQWLWFLYENGLGGLLCDDMGLGKTHQVMALMVALREASVTGAPFLVVCPTSVISHWERKIAEHAPGVTAAVHHGNQRDLTWACSEADVVITSYGILRNDKKALRKISFALAVFDEIQHIKNPQTKAYDAAERINADIKLGLTGTPIENSLAELKSLLDLTVPGYLGDDDVYESRYLVPIEAQRNLDRRRELRRLISPFTLRRKKQSVLAELPEKIEDMRTCILSEEQAKLYRDAVETRAKPLLSSLAEDEGPVPYMHIFALLNLLKQICNHPALVAKTPEAYIDHESGKWDLFTELLEESLDSGQKIVVYSQYLGMIDIIARYLTERRIAYESLTGASRNRGKIVDRFNSDPDCRVFVGSLKAGGVGIDLVAASVVIHYDRWWNAAKEDQATDRVHRIGQTRGVQVFKLVTEGTLEEKIAAIIDKKRNLMDSIVKEDDPSLLKTFSKDDLIELLSMPGRLE
ncbi:MAG: DEAD/DEAH box helicase [Desulfobacterales bacterium]|nr:DEAD/DEAH box helicase [Desulfobacterales bacterium]